MDILSGRISEGDVEKCREVGRAFSAAGERIFLVGGAVRDALLGRPDDVDLDFVTSAQPEAIRRISRKFAESVYDKSGIKGYGTQGVILAGGVELEITPFRSVAGIEAPPGADVPELAADLRARDFTMNAIAVELAPPRWGVPVDPTGGIGDIEKRLVRFPSTPRIILMDDPLRAFRAVRFVCRLGFSLDGEARAAIADFAAACPEGPAAIAEERLRDELFKMLAAGRPSEPVRLLEELGLLERLLPEARRLIDTAPEEGHHHKNLFEHTLGVMDRLAELKPGRPLLVFAALLHDIGKPAARRLDGDTYRFIDHDKLGAEIAGEIGERLRLSGDEVKTLKTLVLKHHRLHQYSAEWSDAAVRRALHELGDLHDDFFALSVADATGRDPERRREREEKMRHYSARVESLDREQVLRPRLPLNGNEIMKLLGISPAARGGGKAVGRALAALKDRVVAGELAAGDCEAARRFVLEGDWNDNIE